MAIQDERRRTPELEIQFGLHSIRPPPPGRPKTFHQAIRALYHWQRRITNDNILSSPSRAALNESIEGTVATLHTSKVLAKAHTELTTGIQERARRKADWSGKRVQKGGPLYTNDGTAAKAKKREAEEQARAKRWKYWHSRKANKVAKELKVLEKARSALEKEPQNEELIAAESKAVIQRHLRSGQLEERAWRYS